MADKEAGDDETPKKKSKLPLIIGAVLVAGLGGGGAWFFLGGKEEPKEGDNYAVQEPRGKPAKTSFVNLDPFTFNLLDADQDRFAKVGVVLEIVDPAVEAELAESAPAIRNALLMLMTSKTSSRLLSVDGKTTLSYEIVDATNAILAGQPAPRIKMPKPKSKKKLKFKMKSAARDDHQDGDERDSRENRDDRDYRDDRDEYDRDDDRRGRNYRRRAPVIPERVYAAHFSQFLVQ